MPLSSAEIRKVVQSQHDDVAALFDELRAGSLDPKGSGVTRDTYGAGEQFAYRVIEGRASSLGLEQRYDHAANLFMTLPGPKQSITAFNYMIETAQVLVRNLNAELRDDAHSVMTAQTIEHCRQRIRDFERKQLTLQL